MTCIRHHQSISRSNCAIVALTKLPRSPSGRAHTLLIRICVPAARPTSINLLHNQVMGAFRVLPVDVFPLVACVTAGCGFLAYSAFRTAFYSGEVQCDSRTLRCWTRHAEHFCHWNHITLVLTDSTRADELQESDIAEEKGVGFKKTSLYMTLGKRFYTPGEQYETAFEPSFCKPEEH